MLTITACLVYKRQAWGMEPRAKRKKPEQLRSGRRKGLPTALTAAKAVYRLNLLQPR